MRAQIRHLTIVAALVVASGFVAWPASAETTICTAVTPPATISSQGIYCLKQNAVVSITTGPAIQINANNVVLDLNGWTLRTNVPAGTDVSGTVGILIGSSRQRVTIRNGTIRGFGDGVGVGGTGSAPGLTGHIIEDLRVVDSVFEGINLPFGEGDVIQRNLVLNTGVGSPSSSTVNVAGITGGSLATVHNNDVVGVSANIAIGINAGGAAVVNNRIKDVSGTLFGVGINCIGTAALRDNIVLGAAPGPAYSPSCQLLGNNNF